MLTHNEHIQYSQSTESYYHLGDKEYVCLCGFEGGVTIRNVSVFTTQIKLRLRWGT